MTQRTELAKKKILQVQRERLRLLCLGYVRMLISCCEADTNLRLSGCMSEDWKRQITLKKKKCSLSGI